MKKLINRPDDVVKEMIEGLTAIYPGLTRLPNRTVITRSDAASARQNQVAIISGGGSGHEPAHAGFVGHGMLSAAVAGDVFTSPAPDAVLAAIRAVTGPPGVLLIVKNYTGDRLNFGLAAELARAEGLKVEVVVVADDVALAAVDESRHVGRRGLAGTILVHKIAGAAAAAGKDLYEVAAAARGAAESVGTMGVALSACTVPAAGKPGFTLAENEVELGLGIHGEPGVRRIPLAAADTLTDQLLTSIAGELRLNRGDRAALLVNNLGGTAVGELAIVGRRAIAALEERGVVVERVYVGTFLSALEMAGVSLSVLRIDDARLEQLDAPTTAPAWPNPTAVSQPHGRRSSPRSDSPADTTVDYIAVAPPSSRQGQAMEAALQAIVQAVAAASGRLTTLDQAVGDGDLGISLQRGAQAIHEGMAFYPFDDPAACLHALGLTVQSAIGGTSGPLYAILLLRAAARLRKAVNPSAPTVVDWVESFRAGCDGVIELGGAGRGDRTMLDALLPAVDALKDALHAGRSPHEAVADAADAAVAGARTTSEMLPRRGRSSYLGQRAVGHADPGAEAVAIWLKALARSLAHE